ncbi:hypothetical protein GWK47_020448 [Chionoecetes opilio]|uniref:Uncharacterized protein n=1 Tax=Chionoecetes opilio TaxID=41210 RepID=A0A8J4XP72_CHIOP|nr:hypothetical protein GWK47_020448 [Chionoecetes opilio]
MVLHLNPEKVDAVISRLLFDVTEQADLDTSEGSSPDEDEEEDFFKDILVLRDIPLEAGVSPTGLRLGSGRDRMFDVRNASLRSSLHLD